MNKLKRWTALALCCILMLAAAACGASPDPSSQPPGSGGGLGRYVETDITPPGMEEEQLASFLGADGTLSCYTRDLKKKFTSSDGGENWQESDGPAAGSALPGTVDNFTLLPDGSLLAALADEENFALTGLVKISPDGTVEPFSVPALDEALASGQTTYINHLQALSADRLFLGFVSGDFGGIAIGDSDDENDNSSALPDSDSPEDTSTGGDADSSTPTASDGSTPDDQSTPDDGASASGGGGFNMGSQTSFAGLIDLASGEVVAEYPDWYGVAATADEDTLYLLDYDGAITAKSLANGKAKPEGEKQLSVADFSFNLSMSNGKDGLYVLDGKKIQKLAAGATAETLLDGSTYSFADPNSMASGIHVLENGDIVLNLASQSGSRLYKYHWDENASLDPNHILKVWSLYENYMVRAAISEFRKQNPEAAVEYEVALGEDDGVTAEDAIKNLNTRLMNGDGPDVMILDDCPADSYAARGMLEDLSAHVDTSGMFQNLAAPFTTDDGTFYLPMNVKIPLLLGTEENLAKATTLQALAALAQQGSLPPQIGDTDDVFAGLPENERPALALDDLSEIFDLLWDAGASNIITGNGLDSAALTELLGALQTISDKYTLGTGGGTSSGAMAVMSSTRGAAATVKGSPLAYASQRALLGGYTADDMQMLQYMLGPPNSSYTSFPGLTDGSFVPSTLVGISADSDKTQLAAQFLNTMLGETVQGTRTGIGFPVTEAGIQKQIADIDEMMQENMGEGFTFDYAPLMALAKTPQLTDAVVKDMVWNVAQSLCEGATDLEGSVKQLEQDLKNYLAERQ